MWPTSTNREGDTEQSSILVSIAQARCGLLPRIQTGLLYPSSYLFQSLKRDVAYFHFSQQIRSDHFEALFQSLKRDVAYFHRNGNVVLRTRNGFQSLKRDVAYFHCIWLHFYLHTLLVSIAQARCGLLPRAVRNTIPNAAIMFQSLKRDVAYFHPAGNVEYPAVYVVSIAQARCGLLPQTPHSNEPRELWL